MARIVAVAGPKRGVAIEIEGRFLIGRSNEASLQLIDEKVSREHCAIEHRGAGAGDASSASVRDLGSRNGTWVNGKRIDGPAELHPGDSISVGETVLLFDPELDVLATGDGDSTLILTRARAEDTASAAAPGEPALRLAGELALRAATAPDPEAARSLAAEALASALSASPVVILAGSGGTLHPVHSSPRGATTSVNRALLELALREGRAVAQKLSQSRAEIGAERTLLRSEAAWVLAAPAFVRGAPVAALCAVRSRAFSPEDLAVATALAGAAASAIAEPPPTMAAGSIPGAEPLVASSRAMREVLDLAAAAAKARSTVLLTGESGTGKEEVAAAIHRMSARSGGPFVPINCGAIPSELAESQLFGHQKGAFTGAISTQAGMFERAHGGTLFLDEVGDLPAALQVKLLRALEERVVHRIGGRGPIGVDVRVIAATHRDLEALVKAGAFREDLYWRLNVVRIAIPPLRDRADDVLPLAERFLARTARELGRSPEGFTPDAVRVLGACAWPGNVRQLANAVERAVVLKRTPGPIGVGDLPPEVIASDGGGPRGSTLAELVRVLEREQITAALIRSRGVKAAAAEALGISRPTLDRKIEEHAISIAGIMERP